MVNKRLWANAIRASPWGRWACTTPMCINCVIVAADTGWPSTAAAEAVQWDWVVFFFPPWFVQFFLGESSCSGLNPGESNTPALSLCGVSVNTGSVWAAPGTSLLCWGRVRISGSLYKKFFSMSPSTVVIYTVSERKCFSSWHHGRIITLDNTAVFLLPTMVFKLMPQNNITLFLKCGWSLCYHL